MQEPLAQLTWYHNITLLEKVDRAEERLWYARQAIAHGWSRSVLVAQIETGLHKRAGRALMNFKATLPPPHSDLAQQTPKDPHVFDFLTQALSTLLQIAEPRTARAVLGATASGGARS